jgi:polysaccharide deacetylase 2 family uncharacterized protein YibQ
MGAVRKILIFLVLTAGIIMLGRFAGKLLPKRTPATAPAPAGSGSTTPLDSTNALPEVVEDTTGGKWQQKLFIPLLRSYGLPEKHLKPKRGFFEIVFPKGKPIHEYALEIEKLCRQNEITVEQGVELRPSGRSVEYLLQSNGQHIKLRASLGTSSMAGSAKLAVVFIEIDSLGDTRLAALEAAKWSKTLVVNPYSPNTTLKKLRFTSPQNEILLELPMEPASYPFVDPGPHAIYIHQTKEDIGKILAEGFDSLPKAVGFATKFGDRAIENLPLLDNLFQYTAGKGLVFLDLTGSQRSLARQSAAGQGARSRTLVPFRDSLHVDEELTRKAVQAQKTGEAVLVLPYTEAGFRAIENSLAVNADHFEELGLDLVTYSALLATPGDSILPDVRAPIAKPKPVAEVIAPRKAPPTAVATPAKASAKPTAHPAAQTATKPAGKPASKAVAKPVTKPSAKPALKTNAKKPTKKTAKPKGVPEKTR